MDQEQTSRMQEEEAARWYARLRAPGCSAAEQQTFHAWLEADPAHPIAYERVMSAAMQVSAGLRSDPALKALLDQALEDRADAAPRGGLLPRWLMRPVMAGALAVLCALMVGHLLWRDEATSAPVQRLVNDGNARREVRLDDGSVVRLDVGAELTVQMLADARRLQLHAGRAYFEVAHDASRPFTVEGGDTRTTALGTQFEVDVRDAGASVTLAEGSVAVTAAGEEPAWSRRLSPGQQLVSQGGQSSPVLRRVDVQEVVGWSTGKLRFHDAQLRDVVAEWNRYARVRISLGDNALADAHVGGTFQAGGDSNEFVAALAAVLPVRALPVGATEILLVREYQE